MAPLRSIDFSLVIPSRKTTVLVGSSGCGKTTLLRMINRMVDPSSGSIEIDGEDTVEPRAGRTCAGSIGYVMQNSGLLPHRKVIDNVATVPRAERCAETDRRSAQALELLDTVGLDRSLGGPLPEPALRRAAAARRSRARPGRRPQHPAHGRTVRRRRPDRARGTAAGTHPTAARAGQDGRLRHPRHRRGVPARRPGRHPARRAARSRRSARRPRSSPTRRTTSWPTSSACEKGKRALSIRKTAQGRHRGRQRGPRRRRARRAAGRRRAG